MLRILLRRAALGAWVLGGLAVLGSASEPVTVREVDETIPTYLSGPPDPNPMFFFGRQSQGAEGRIYPYPLFDNLTNQRGEKTYHLVYLENEYVRIAILPEIGGRLFSAVDKTNGYDFVYHQHVIKPALIGLLGAWISGGIEWNIPHHHRASTFSPVQWRVEDQPDGGKTVWVGELEIRQQMRWAVGYTLRPGSSVLECSVRILNRTPLVNTMLCFANVAVHTNDQYQILFPPGTQWVTQHEKVEFTSWPIAHSRHGSADFSAGVDVSWYKNHEQANSMFAWNDTDDFFAGYDHGKQAGTVSVADHAIVPGKKFFTWGSGPRGRMWDEILTDTDGPYLELMVGAYSDNQPDYSWLQPFAARSFTMSWYPFRDIGGLKHANRDAAVNLDVEGDVAKLGLYTTASHPRASLRLLLRDREILAESVAIDPGHPLRREVKLPPGTPAADLRAVLADGERELIAYAPVQPAPTPRPATVTPPPAPKDIANSEELFLAGQRVDQFHDPALEPETFWAEALRRDAGDSRAHLGLGLVDLRRARFADAERHLRQALDRLTANYTAPKNTEAYYYLGVALRGQDKDVAATAAFDRAIWSQEWQAPAYFALAELAAKRGDFAAALALADRSLDANALNVRAYGLKATVLRHLHRDDEARAVVAFAMAKTDPLDGRLMAEAFLLGKKPGAEFSAVLSAFPSVALELAAEYANAGLWQDASDLVGRAVAAAPDPKAVSPLLYYYLGDWAERLGASAPAQEYRRLAAAAPYDYVFPFQTEMIPVLQRAIASQPQDARARLYLGNVLFDLQPDAAVAAWEQAVALDPDLAVAWRNLAQAYAHRDLAPAGEMAPRALAALEKAVASPRRDATQLAELDQLYATAGTPVAKRLALLEQYRALAGQKDDSLASLIDLKIFAGQTDEAIALLKGHTFNVWEGGTRYSTGDSWTNAHLARGRQRLQAQRYREALADFRVALEYPANLRAGESFVAFIRRAEVSYWTARAHDALGEAGASRQAYTEAAREPDPRLRRWAERSLALRADRHFQARALQKLGDAEAARQIWQELVASASDALAAPGGGVSVDPNNSNFGGEESPRLRSALAHYIAGLGQLGLGKNDEAQAQFSAALASVPDYLAARLAMDEP